MKREMVWLLLAVVLFVLWLLLVVPSTVPPFLR
jgi:hypothetical protein